MLRQVPPVIDGSTLSGISSFGIQVEETRLARGPAPRMLEEQCALEYGGSIAHLNSVPIDVLLTCGNASHLHLSQNGHLHRDRSLEFIRTNPDDSCGCGQVLGHGTSMNAKHKAVTLKRRPNVGRRRDQ